jgi:hypothetical protein
MTQESNNIVNRGPCQGLVLKKRVANQVASVACVGRVRPTHPSPLLHPSLTLAAWEELGKGRG